MSTPYFFGNDSIVCHCFNAKCDQLALSSNSNDVLIFKLNNRKYQLSDRLTEHTATVRSIDWAHKTDRLLTCSADRNAYVWTRDNEQKWKPTLVILQLNRAATFCRWSPQENKFAVGSGSKVIAVCYFEKDHDWWVSKHIKKSIKSTVTCLDWHPNNVLVACGATDYKVRVYSAFLKSEESQPAECNWSAGGKKMLFQSVLFEGSSDAGWILSVSFSADGNSLAWSTQTSSVFVAVSQPGGGNPTIQSIVHPYLPFLSITWMSSKSLLLAGHDCKPYALDVSSAKFTEMDIKTEAKETKFSAMKMFQDKDRKAESADSTLDTLHQNAINEVRVIEGSKSSASKVSTVGRDGMLVIWDLRTLQQRIADLKI